jgi:hypothetical protein
MFKACPRTVEHSHQAQCWTLPGRIGFGVHAYASKGGEGRAEAGDGNRPPVQIAKCAPPRPARALPAVGPISRLIRSALARGPRMWVALAGNADLPGRPGGVARGRLSGTGDLY